MACNEDARDGLEADGVMNPTPKLAIEVEGLSFLDPLS